MAAMPHRTAPDETPKGHLAEGGLHGIVGYQLAQARLTTNQLFVENIGSPFGLRPVAFTILALVERNPGVSARQLARALAVTPPNLTTWLEQLERRGLVGRERSAADRRSHHVTLTPAGQALVRDATQRVLAAERAALALTEGERTLLLELLHKVATARPPAAAR